ncbi:MAG: hypothetical protein QOE33_3474 [Acidobacteriota bacterium]|nr:hypothetical protein [Acidobacteriota bacterium]
MALGLMGMLDLSIVTDRLIELLEQWRDSSPLWTALHPKFDIEVSGSAPDIVRAGGGTQLSIYLFHVSQSKFLKNSPVTGAGAGVPAIPFQPLSLELYYLLTAFANKNFHHEQQAMSIALSCFHENPIVRKNVTIGNQTVPEEFTLTMETETADELGRLWQSLTVPARLSAVFKVSVVFMPPQAPLHPPAPKPKQIGLSVDPITLPYAGKGQIVGTLRRVNYRSPDLVVQPQPDVRGFDQSPATVAAGQSFLLLLTGRNQPTTKRVYLLMPDDSEVEITSWIDATSDVTTLPHEEASRITLKLPNTVGAPPANTPTPGVYRLRVGSDTAQGDDETYRSNATPFSIAARITGPAGTPLLPGPPYTVSGVGFVAGKTEVLLDTISLTEGGAVLNAGEFSVGAGGASINLLTPGNFGAGLYTVRVRVNNVESDPTWWIQV